MDVSIAKQHARELVPPCALVVVPEVASVLAPPPAPVIVLEHVVVLVQERAPALVLERAPVVVLVLALALVLDLAWVIVREIVQERAPINVKLIVLDFVKPIVNFNNFIVKIMALIIQVEKYLLGVH